MFIGPDKPLPKAEKVSHPESCDLHCKLPKQLGKEKS